MLYEPPVNATTTTGMFQWINGTTKWGGEAGLLFPGIIFAIFIIVLVKQMTNPGNTFSKCFASASFIGMILSVFARTLSLCSTWFMTIFIVLVAVGAVWMHIENN